VEHERTMGFYENRQLSAGRIIDDGGTAGARDAHAALFQVTQCNIHHRRHERVVEGIVLDERRKAEILEDRGKRQIDRCIRRRIAILALVVELRDLNARIG
jgi:hypothetical protein